MATGMGATLVDEKIYVAVTGNDLESKSSLVWAIKNSGGKEFCIVHVHQPIQLLVLGTLFHDPRKEKEKAHKNLDKYLHVCRQMQVSAEKIYIEKDSVEEGLLQLISQRGVRKLVMGAAADKHYSMNMRDLQSKKAIYICSEAPATCQIWFTCNGYLICSREARRRDNLSVDRASSSSLYQSEITRGTEAENSKREARFEAYKREEAERAAIIKRAVQSENKYFQELKRRRETEEALSKAKEEIGKMRSESETQITESSMVIRKLQDNNILAKKALRRLKEEQEELEIKLREVSKLKDKSEEEASSSKDREPPHYFICPITQDIMEDPHVAADGFTYEREAICSWFKSGHKTSPMTNKTLPHTNLVPNLALRSAIQEWLQDSSS